jgi:hypothetical protein
VGWFAVATKSTAPHMHLPVSFTFDVMIEPPSGLDKPGCPPSYGCWFKAVLIQITLRPRITFRPQNTQRPGIRRRIASGTGSPALAAWRRRVVSRSVSQ